ncbi:MAG: hypothetical protein LBL53_00440 [Endomicrobium sp.]|jgi:DNA polymerase III delta prime subunit|nr:hypothetical protein [Endomicrobium sp.]
MFNNIYGQLQVKKIISNQIIANNIPNSYVFVGQDGVGKSCTAWEFVKILNCDKNVTTSIDLEPCRKCSTCIKIEKNIHPDVHYINIKKHLFNKKIDIKNLNEYLVSKVIKYSYESKWKILIIESAENMDISSSNLLLNVFDRNYNNLVVIMLTENKEIMAVKHKIIFYSHILFFKPLNDTTLLKWLKLNYPLFVNSSKIQKLIDESNGSIGKMKLLIKNYSKHLYIKEEINNLLTNIRKNKLYISEAFNLSQSISKNKEKTLDYIDKIIDIVSCNINYSHSINILKLLFSARSLIVKNININMVLDNLFLDLLNSNLKI